jgi:hypothetical protein
VPPAASEEASLPVVSAVLLVHPAIVSTIVPTSAAAISFFIISIPPEF